ncbi:hypothetical protein [Novosphingobium resinovorum]|uniref:hypothetical protein n=1 Tax=Novosphingobium resinovorum TaxID=158500 RepID=UPI002ED12174|nr:hypothetical protein [Novosphingobium resinovorum]
MAERDNMIAAWLAAIERFREARRALDEWKANNPYPGTDLKSEDFDDANAQVTRWEKGADAFGVPYQEAVEALHALPAPNLDAVIVKVQLAGEDVRGQDIEDRLSPILQTIEQDLRRLVVELEAPAPVIE